ncbi:MAG: sulfite exporter TauE/SafE family protein [Candidatus Hatepunaea meridiana]|nr:sulfite exporter TauE/SafE family protein [Candidatus Hatepunaea meridiana]
MTSTLIITIGILIVFIGGLTQGLLGFGFGLVAIPILIIILPPVVVVPTVMLITTLLAIVILCEARKSLELKRILPLMAAGVAGLPLGAYILKNMDVNYLKVFIGLVIIVFSFALLLGYKRKVKNEKLGFAPIGFLSGLLNTSTGLSGPPVILFFSNQGIGKESFRANMVAYFTVLNIVAVPIYILNDLINPTVIRYSFIFVLPMMIGAILGIKLAHRINENLFRRIALVIVSIGGLVTIISGIGIMR